MKLKQIIAFAALALTLGTPALAQEEKTPAFPGAEGYGRYVTGGRGGKAYHVTNLNDSGTGSLRWALGQKGAKTIVFDVSGTIHLKSALAITDNTTVAGQTAPGDGICIADYPCSIKGSNVIVRYMRFRLGNKYVLQDGADGWDGFGAMDQQDIIIDHCSVSWSIDECLSVLGNKNTTVQWCLVAQSLVDAGHSKGKHGYGGNWGGSGASFHHNLIVHHSSRTPRFGPRPTTQMDERMDYRNNVIYNFGGNGCYGGEAMKVNVVNNYYKPGPGTPTDKKGKRIAGIGIRTTEYVTNYPAYKPAWHIWGKFFVEGNKNSKYSDVATDNWANGIYNQISSSDNDGTFTSMTRDTMKIDEPIPFVYTTTHTADDAYTRVLDYAGASKSRDSFDELMVSDARNGAANFTGKDLSKGFINSQEDNRPVDADDSWSAWPTLNQRGTITDTDGDGIPDSWEDNNGLDNTDATDALQLNAQGYTMLEVYLNSLVANITNAQNAGGVEMGDRIYKEIAEDGTEPGKTLLQNGEIAWPFGNDISEVNISSEISGYVATTNQTFGSNVSYNKSRSINGVRFAEISHTVDNEATANDDNAVKFFINMREGYHFRPTKISFLASKIGTDGGAIDAVWHNQNGEYEVASNLNPNRNNETGGWFSTVEKEMTVGSAPGTSSLYLHVYKMGNGKVMGLSSISIDGDVLQNAATGIDNAMSGRVQTTYHSLHGTLLQRPQSGITIETTILPDGTRQSRKIVRQ